MIDQRLFDWAPLVVVLPPLVFMAEFCLSVLVHRRSLRVRDRWSVENSQEADDRWAHLAERRLLVRRLVYPAVALLAYMVVVWLFAHGAEVNPRIPAGMATAVFAAGAGLLLLLQVVRLMTQLASLGQLHFLSDARSTTGTIVISGWAAYGSAATGFARFALLWAVLAAASLQVFFAAGAVSSAVMAARMWRRATLLRRSAVA